MKNPLAETPDAPRMLFSVVGIMLCIGFVSYLSMAQGFHILIASLGATSIILFASPESKLAKPKNVIVGHLLAAVMGVLSFYLLGMTWAAVTLATTLTFVAMILTDTVHPPGGATAISAVLASAGPMFILTPVMLGAVSVTAIALAVNRAHKAYADKHAHA